MMLHNGEGVEHCKLSFYAVGIPNDTATLEDILAVSCKTNPTLAIIMLLTFNLRERNASVQSSLVTQSCPCLCNPMNHSTPGFPVHHNSWSSLKLMFIESVMPSRHLILCCPLLLLPPSLPASNESTLCIRWPKYWSFSFNISLSNEHPGLISFRIGWLDLLAVQRTLKSILQHHSSKASVLQHSAFFIVQLSHPIHDY